MNRSRNRSRPLPRVDAHTPFTPSSLAPKRAGEASTAPFTPFTRRPFTLSPLSKRGGSVSALPSSGPHETQEPGDSGHPCPPDACRDSDTLTNADVPDEQRSTMTPEAELAAINTVLARADIKTRGAAGVTDLFHAFDGQYDLAAQADVDKDAAAQRAEQTEAVLTRARAVRDVHRLRHPEPLPDCIACSIGAALDPTAT